MLLESLIVTDMDGTFLDDYSNFDRNKFVQIYSEMIRANIGFVVASGNQYEKLRSYFPNLEKIFYVSDNGSKVVDSDGSLLWLASIDKKSFNNVIEYLDESRVKIDYLICGNESAYVKNTMTPKFRRYIEQSYIKLMEYREFSNISDNFYKIAMKVEPLMIEEIILELENKFGDVFDIVHSKHGDIDLMVKSVNKFSGLEKIIRKYNISNENIYAFGDSGNDYEIISKIKNSYAVSNATPQIKNLARNIIGSNNDQSVLTQVALICQTLTM